MDVQLRVSPLLAIAVAACTAAAAGGGGSASPTSPSAAVLDLAAAGELQDAIDRTPLLLVEFYAPWFEPGRNR